MLKMLNEFCKPYVNHIDNNILNNCASNLEWCTQQENVDHMVRQGRHNFKAAKGVKPKSTKLTPEQVLCIRKETGLHRVIAIKYNISRRTVSDIKTYRSWKDI